MVEAVLNYVRGVQRLTILFNNPTLARDKIQELTTYEVTRACNASTQKYDLRFKRPEATALSMTDQREQSEEVLLRRWMTKTSLAATVMIKCYVSGRWTDDGVYVEGHYAEVHK